MLSGLMLAPIRRQLMWQGPTCTGLQDGIDLTPCGMETGVQSVVSTDLKIDPQ